MNDTEPGGFADPFEGDAERRVYGTVVGLRSPTTAATVAERSDCDPDTARKYLDWFAELGVVTREDGRPTTYERNDAYFEWRRVTRLASDHSTAELRDRVRRLTDRIEEYEDRYDASHPSRVDAVAAATDRSVDEVYADLGDWATAIEDRELAERARRRRAGQDRDTVSG